MSLWLQARTKRDMEQQDHQNKVNSLIRALARREDLRASLMENLWYSAIFHVKLWKGLQQLFRTKSIKGSVWITKLADIHVRFLSHLEVCFICNNCFVVCNLTLPQNQSPDLRGDSKMSPNMSLCLAPTNIGTHLSTLFTCLHVKHYASINHRMWSFSGLGMEETPVFPWAMITQWLLRASFMAV